MNRQVDWVDVIGRLLLSSIFIVSGVMKFVSWGDTLGMVRSYGLPWPEASLFLAGAIEVLGGLAVLLGAATRGAALMLFLYLIPVTLTFHAFWTLHGPDMQMQFVNFLKNLTIMGGLLVLAANGAGPMSVDARGAEDFERDRDEHGRRAA